MINIKLHKNEVQLIKESIESSKWFGNEPKLCDRVLKKLDKALTIPVVSESFSKSDLLDLGNWFDGSPEFVEEVVNDWLNAR